MPKLSGQIAIVTGAARQRGIGRAIAVRLAEDGADVVVCARASDRLPEYERAAGWKGADSVVDEITALGRRAISVVCDVRSETDVQAAFAASVAAFGIPSIIVNNAAAPSTRGKISLAELDLAAWKDTLDVNLTGAFLVAKIGARYLLDAGKTGSIINIGSITGRLPMAGFGAYCTAKAGMIALTQQLSLELAPHGIRVNCACPGTTNTDLLASAQLQAEREPGGAVAAMLANVQNMIPMKRVSTPEEQAAVVSFLASADASFITGQSINVDGGVRMD